MVIAPQKRLSNILVLLKDVQIDIKAPGTAEIQKEKRDVVLYVEAIVGLTLQPVLLILGCQIGEKGDDID